MDPEQACQRLLTREFDEVDRIVFNNIVDSEDWKPGKMSEPNKKRKISLVSLPKSSRIFGEINPACRRETTEVLHRIIEQGFGIIKHCATKKTDNEKTKIEKGINMKWCANNCHEKPMRCNRRNCLGNEDFKTIM